MTHRHTVCVYRMNPYKRYYKISELAWWHEQYVARFTERIVSPSPVSQLRLRFYYSLAGVWNHRDTACVYRFEPAQNIIEVWCDDTIIVQFSAFDKVCNWFCIIIHNSSLLGTVCANVELSDYWKTVYAKIVSSQDYWLWVGYWLAPI